MLGLPDGITACLFDMDGVITQTAKVHDAAWKEMFDEFLRDWSKAHNEKFVSFDSDHDYDEYVDGKPRADGIESFLDSRGIKLPEGQESDKAGTQTVYGLGNRKNDLFLQVLKRDGVQPYEGSVHYLEAVRKAGLRTAIVSSSANTADVLKSAGVAGNFEVRIDHQAAAEHKLRGKPAPDTYLEAAKELGVPAAHAAVFEDALSGVAAGKAGHFGFVVGVDRVGQAGQLRAHGADVVVKDLAELLP
jgi:beta-phosphoglucomutase family hydrolase